MASTPNTQYRFDINKYRDLISQFRQKVADILEPEHDDYYVMRWLKARNFDIKKSEDMLRKHLIWRKEENVDQILRRDFPEVVNKYYPGGHCGFDKDGCPVWITPLGNIDAKGLLRSTKKKEVVMKEVYNAEYVQMLMISQTQKLGKKVDQMILIYDLENFGMKHLWKPGMDTLIKFLAVFEDNYPEAMKTAFVINAPMIFPVVYKLIRPILSDETVNKMRIYGCNYKEELLKCIHPDQLPKHWGGELVDEFFDERCSSMIVQGGEVPKRYYIQLSPEEMENFKTVNVKRGSSLQVDIDIKTAGSVIRWQFTTEGYDLGFGVYKRTKGEKQNIANMVNVIRSQRVDSHLVPEDGSVVVKDPGTYVVRFDNTYSYLRSKKISYLLEVLEPDTIEVETRTYDTLNRTVGDESDTSGEDTVLEFAELKDVIL